LTREYVAKLVRAYPRIREVWLFGSRANGTDTATSDWDYLAFADDDTLSALSGDEPFHQSGIDLMVVVTDGVRFVKPWVGVDDDGKQKHGTLADDVSEGGLAWNRRTETEARYTQWKPDPSEAKGFNCVAAERCALRLYPA
jgi:Polymerase beta, Nucleotidyltransferase